MSSESWESIVFDTVQISAGATSYSFFHGRDIEASDDDFRMVESDVIKFIATNFKTQLCSILGLEAHYSCFEMFAVSPYTESSKTPGDIDIIIHNKMDPRDTTAIEVKILRKRPTDLSHSYLNGIKRIPKGIEQAAGLNMLGFSRSYLMIVVLANTSIFNDRNLATRNLPMSNWEKIRNIFDDLGRQKGIGLINIEINMNSEKPVNESGQISGFMYYECRREQSPSISEISAMKTQAQTAPRSQQQ